jgi:predicted nucleotidyltransferase
MWQREASGNGMQSVDWTIDGLPEETQKLLKSYVKDVAKAYGNELEGIILYGSAVRGEFLPGRSNLNVLLVIASYNLAGLKKYDSLHKRWSKEQVVVPLFLTAADLQSASFAFPLEYQDIHECHRLLWGQDPFVGLKIDSRHLAGEVLQMLRGNLLRLRQRLVEGQSTEEAITILLPLSITALLPALRGVQRLLGRPVLALAEPLLNDLATCLEVDLAGLHDALLLKRGQISPGQKEIPRLMDRYLESLTRLVTATEARIK